MEQLIVNYLEFLQVLFLILTIGFPIYAIFKYIGNKKKQKQLKDEYFKKYPELKR